MEAQVHQELLCFLAKHNLENIFSNVDEIVLSYLVSVVELINDSVDDDVLDVVELMEMMNAYLPGFDQIERSEVIDWMFGLTGRMATPCLEEGEKVSDRIPICSPEEGEKVSDRIPICSPEEGEKVSVEQTPGNAKKDVMADEKGFPIYDYKEKSGICQAACGSSAPQSGCADSTKLNNWDTNTKHDIKRDKDGNGRDPCLFVTPSHSKDKETPTSTKPRSLTKSGSLHTYSMSNDNKDNGSSREDQDNSYKHVCEEDQVRVLLEMFPTSCWVEARHCLRLSAGDMDHTAQLIMDRQDTGAAFSEHASSSVERVKDKKEGDSASNASGIKTCLLEKYSFIDTEEDKKTHRPPPPKKDAKKLVRYRDGQVVSTKGEKFSAVEKKDEGDMKHTYVNLKPARKYRFH